MYMHICSVHGQDSKTFLSDNSDVMGSLLAESDHLRVHLIPHVCTPCRNSEQIRTLNKYIINLNILFTQDWSAC